MQTLKPRSPYERLAADAIERAKAAERQRDKLLEAVATYVKGDDTSSWMMRTIASQIKRESP